MCFIILKSQAMTPFYPFPGHPGFYKTGAPRQWGTLWHRTVDVPAPLSLVAPGASQVPWPSLAPLPPVASQVALTAERLATGVLRIAPGLLR